MKHIYTVEEHPVEKSKWVIKHCFAEDNDLVSRFHIAAGADLDTCVENTFTTLCYGTVNYRFFRLLQDGECVGYFGTELLNEKKYLTSFAIAVPYRNDEVKKELWSAVRNSIGHWEGEDDKKVFVQEEFYCGLYEKNARAVSFIERQGGVIVSEGGEGDEKFVTFKIK